MTWRRRRIEAPADDLEWGTSKWVPAEPTNYYSGQTCALSIAAATFTDGEWPIRPTRTAHRCRWCKQLTVADRCDHCGGPQ